MKHNVNVLSNSAPNFTSCSLAYDLGYICDVRSTLENHTVRTNRSSAQKVFTVYGVSLSQRAEIRYKIVQSQFVQSSGLKVGQVSTFEQNDMIFPTSVTLTVQTKAVITPFRENSVAASLSTPTVVLLVLVLVYQPSSSFCFCQVLV